MSTLPGHSPGRRAAIVIPWVIGVVAIVAVRYRGSWPLYRSFHEWMHAAGIPGSVRNYDGLLLYTAAAVIGAAVVVRMHGGRVAQALCWQARSRNWAAMVAVSCLPMVGGGVLAIVLGGGGHVDANAWPALSSSVIRAPLGEELLFRGLLVAVPASALGWHGRRWWHNAVLAAAAFGALHIPWSAAALHGWPNFLVTFAGGLWYAWLLGNWQSLWVPIGLHAGMNLGWFLIGASGGAGGGGLLPNVLRVATIAVATIWTLRTVDQRPAPST